MNDELSPAESAAESSAPESPSGPALSLVTESRAPRSPALRFAVPALAVLTAAGAGFLGWKYASSRDVQAAQIDSVTAARDTTIAMLSYTPDTAEKELNDARDRLTGTFLDSYTKLINDVVIPGSRDKRISAVAQVPAAASVSAAPEHAVVLVFVDQTVTVGKDAPTNTNWSVRVTLDKVGDRWLISGFDPV